VISQGIEIMAKTAPSFVDQLKDSLQEELSNVGIESKVDVEAVPTTRLYRILVLAPKFKALKHTERQSLVWRIAERALAPDEQLRISMILTLTPNEAAGK
jgi:hypothetical protein